MKKLVLIFVALTLLFSVSVSLADTDKEIQFSGHTFGESFEQSIQGERVQEILFDSYPQTSRLLSDPLANRLGWALYGESIPVTYSVNLWQYGPRDVAGHNASARLCFYYTTAEDSDNMNIRSGVFYAGIYDFYEDPDATFNDLKAKLSSVYGDPSAEGTDGEEIWGALTPGQNVSESDWQSNLQNEKQSAAKATIAVWNSSANNASLVLEKVDDNGWAYTRLFYIDTTADAAILSLYEASQGAGASDSLNGL